METKRANDNFKDIYSTLEDLYLLGDSSLYPLFERLHFHLNEIKEVKKEEKVPDLDNLSSLFEEKIKSEIVTFFRDSEVGSQIDLLNKMRNPSLRQMDTILNIFPMAKELIKDFQLHKNIQITLENETILFEGEVSLENNLEDLRDRTYMLTRRLFKERVLLTFDLFETQKRDSYRISFKFSFSHSQEKFKFDIGKDKVLMLPVLFDQFRTSLSQVEKLGPHRVYELTDSFDLKVLNREKDLDSFHQESDLVFHFPFLFRPISLIMKRYFSPKGEEYQSEKDGMLNASNSLLFEVDLFSLLQK